MEYRKKRNEYYAIFGANECWVVNTSTGTIKKETNGRKIEAILLRHNPSCKEDYEEAYVYTLKVNKKNFRQAQLQN